MENIRTKAVARDIILLKYVLDKNKMYLNSYDERGFKP